MNYKICCISHNRHENVRSFLEKVGTDDVTFFVKDQDDLRMYKQAGAIDVVITGSLINSRNMALKNSFSEGKICVQLSDDLETIKQNNFSGKRMDKKVSVLQVLETILPEFIQSKYLLSGFPPTDNPFFALNETDINKFIVGDFIIVKPCKLLFDDKLSLKEDYDYTLQHIQAHDGCVRYGSFLTTFKHYKNKGGAVDYRTEQLEQQTIKYLLQKWGSGCLTLNPKRKNEILINRDIKFIDLRQKPMF